MKQSPATHTTGVVEGEGVWLGLREWLVVIDGVPAAV
jgi:hypothetical protein